MSRRVLSDKEIRERIARANEERDMRAKEKLEYDAAYRKSAFFRYSYIIRFVMLLYSVYFYFFDTIPFYPATEVISSAREEREVVQTRRSKYVNIYIHLQTTANNRYDLFLEQTADGTSYFYKGDRVGVINTLLNKPAYLSMKGDSYIFILTKHLYYRQFFLFVGIVSLVSMFMIGGYEKASRYFVKFATFLGPLSLLLYLLI